MSSKAKDNIGISPIPDEEEYVRRGFILPLDPDLEECHRRGTNLMHEGDDRIVPVPTEEQLKSRSVGNSIEAKLKPQMFEHDPKGCPECDPSLYERDETVEKIREYIQNLELASEEKDEKEKPSKATSSEKDLFYQSCRTPTPPPTILENDTFEGFLDYLKRHNCKNIITMAGAGISTSAGIPDFRSPGSGLYHNLKKYNLPDPHAVFEITYFRKNPQPFFVLAKELYPGNFRPTKCHYFIKLLNDKGLLLRHYTQNIDTLERFAGIPDDKIIEAHGTFHTSHCLECGAEYSLEWMREQIFADRIPKCKKCDYYVKPDIIFFGEDLPSKFFKTADSDFPKCDALIILGSSLVVQPFASLIDRVSRTCPRLLINLEKAGERSRFSSLLGISEGFEFGSSKKRDVFKKASCDDGCQTIADALGFGEELKNLVLLEHERIDKEKKTDEASGIQKDSKTKTPKKEWL